MQSKRPNRMAENRRHQKSPFHARGVENLHLIANFTARKNRHTGKNGIMLKFAGPEA